MNRTTANTVLAILIAGVAMGAGMRKAEAADISIAPPPIATPSYAGKVTRMDFTYIGFDKLDGDGYGVSFNHKNPITDHSGIDIVGALYAFEFGDTTSSIVSAGVNYEHLLLDKDTLDLIGFIGPTGGVLYFESCAGGTCFEDYSGIYGAQGGLQLEWDVGAVQIAPFFIFQTLSGSDIDAFTTTSLGLDMIFGDYSLSGALNETEDDDLTILSFGVRF